MRYVRDRETFGRPLGSRQVIRHRLAELARPTEVDRHYRDSCILGIGGGTNGIMTEVVARLLLT